MGAKHHESPGYGGFGATIGLDERIETAGYLIDTPPSSYYMDFRLPFPHIPPRVKKAMNPGHIHMDDIEKILVMYRLKQADRAIDVLDRKESSAEHS